MPNACFISGIANVLARESRMDAIHFSGVLGWIEQSDISFPHMQVGEPSFCCSFAEDTAGIGIPLNSDNWIMSEDEVGKESASDAGK